VSFYFCNGRHDMRCNGRILCARVATALKGGPARKAANLTAICEPAVWNI
jgi:hypothetical protein